VMMNPSDGRSKNKVANIIELLTFL